MPADLAVIGLGPFGLPLAQAAVAAGIPTIGYRTGPEPGSLSPAEQRRMLAQGFRVTTSAAELGRVRTAVICAPTAPAADGGLDLGQVEAAARTLAAQLRPHTTVILESPCRPAPRRARCCGCWSPGPACARAATSTSPTVPAVSTPATATSPPPAPRRSSAASPPLHRVGGGLLRPHHRQGGPRPRPREAETVQLLETNFRHVNIALVNEMAALCHDLGIDLWDVLRCAETKPFGFLAFRPGPGVGGHTVPQDLTAHAGRTLRMAELAQEVNGRMPRYVVQRAAALLNEHGKSARGARVLLLGVTYKADLADLQGSPAQEIAVRLMELGASVSYHDPHVPSWNILDRPVPRADSLYEAAADADLTILLQQHRTYDLQGLSVKAQLLLDTRGATPTGAAHRL